MQTPKTPKFKLLQTLQRLDIVSFRYIHKGTWVDDCYPYFLVEQVDSHNNVWIYFNSRSSYNRLPVKQRPP
jgi:hypothetical protein